MKRSTMKRSISSSIIFILVFILLAAGASAATRGATSAQPLSESAVIIASQQQAQQVQQGNCLNQQRCKEIDEVWVRVAQWLLTNRKGKVWDTVKGWISFDQVYGKGASTSGAPTSPIPGSTAGCPPGMANIDGKYCIDKWEDIVVDKNTNQQASYNWVPDPKLVNGQKSLPPNPLQPAYPDAAGPQFSNSFTALAVSQQNVFPQTYMNRKIAEEACSNAGKRLCTREEWYNACVGPSGQKVSPGATVFPEVMPYGTTRINGVCNDNQQAKHPPQLLGQSQVYTQDPRLATKAQEVGAVAKTGQFSQCTNGYGVFDMAGNVDEIVSDIPEGKPNNMMSVGGYYSRQQTGINGISCGSRITAHDATSYYDYSVGFRCCAEPSALGAAQTSPQLPSQAPSQTTGISSAAQALVNTANQEWDRWGKGSVKEDDPDMRQYIKEKYFGSTPRCVNEDPLPAQGKKEGTAWSAAFVSFIAKTSGISDFPADCAHTNYFQSIYEGKPVYWPKNDNKGQSLTCKTHPISEKDNVKAGDIVCFCRQDENRDKGQPCKIEYGASWGKSHCDIVTKVVGSGLVEVVGGNVNNNVEKRIKDLNDQKWFGFISCGGSAQVMPAPAPAPVPASRSTSTLIGPDVWCTGNEGQPSSIYTNRINDLAWNSGGKTYKDLALSAASNNVNPALVTTHMVFESSMGLNNKCTSTNGRSALTGCTWSGGSCETGSKSPQWYASDEKQVECTAKVDEGMYKQGSGQTTSSLPLVSTYYTKCSSYSADPDKMWKCLLCVYQGNYDKDATGKGNSYFLKDGTCSYAESFKQEYCKWNKYYGS